MNLDTKKYIGAIDQGTTSTRFVVFNKKGNIVSMHQLEHRQIYPKPGWVEHDPEEIIKKTYEVMKITIDKANIGFRDLAAIGITNQRETTIVWNKKTGKPYYNAIVWQDTRTDEICKKIALKGDINCYRENTGLPIATYFSGPKVRWILDNIKDVKKAVKDGEAIFGNIDTWLIWNLTGGINGGVHVTDVTNASRTMLMNLKTLNWDDKMLEVLDIDKNMLPEIKASSYIYGYTNCKIFSDKIPISGDLGDQQAALFGQTCFEKGEAKNTYGTGCFLLLNTGNNIIHSKHGLITTLGYKIGEEKPVYVLEGSIAIAGSLVQWFRDNFGLLKKSSEIEELARKAKDNGGIYFVPAFSGLFAPYWRSDARGVITGLTHYVEKSHFARAILEATAFQTRDIFDAMQKDSDINFKSLKVDGGMVANELLMQFQSDILNIPVIRPKITETTVLGASYAAGLAVGFWKSKDQLSKNWSIDKKWSPKMNNNDREKLYKGWKRSVERSFNWI